MEKVTADRVVIYKRDPVENRDSYISNYVRVDDTGFIAKLNSYDLCKNGKSLPFKNFVNCWKLLRVKNTTT